MKNKKVIFKVAKKEIEVDFDEHKLEEVDDFDNDSFFSEETKVKDVSRYTINGDNTSFFLKAHKGNPKKGRTYVDNEIVDEPDKSVVLIIESPHKDEYNYDKGLKPLSPANGKTGERIAKSLDQVLECACRFVVMPDLEGAELIICNPIQWQTSMHFYYENQKAGLNQDLRNKVWRNIWEIEAIKKDFKERLDLYAPCLIINACTGGPKNEKGLNVPIKKYLQKKFPKVTRFSCYHPSHPSWNSNQFGINVEAEV